MLAPRLLSASLALFVFALASAGNAPAPQRSLPAGEWSVEVANGVVEICAIRKDGTASESEPRRKSLRGVMHDVAMRHALFRFGHARLGDSREVEGQFAEVLEPFQFPHAIVAHPSIPEIEMA
jgi:hypothetical protein